MAPVDDRASLKGPLPLHEINWSSVDDETLKDFVEGHYEAGKMRRQRWSRRGQFYLAWAGGDQTRTGGAGTNEIIDDIMREVGPETDSGDIPMKYQLPVFVNTLRGMLLQRIAFMVARPLTFTARSLAATDSAIAAARLGGKLLQWQWFNGDCPTRWRMLDGLWQMMCTGISVAKTTWNSDVGQVKEFTAEVMNFEPSKGMIAELIDHVKGFEERLRKARKFPDKEGKVMLASGQPEIEFRSGMDITESPMATDVKNCSFILDSKWVSMEALNHEFPNRDDIDPQHDTDGYLEAYKGMYGLADTHDDRNADDLNDHMVLRHEIWRPQLPWLLPGFMGVVAGGAVLRKGPHPYKHGKLPFARLHETPDSEHFRPPSYIHNLITLAIGRNEFVSTMRAYASMRLDPKVLHEEDAQIPDELFEPGPKAVKVKDGALAEGKIKNFELADFPQEAANVQEMMNEYIKDVGQVHDASSGRRTSSSESGKHAEALQSANARSNSVAREFVEEALSSMGEQSLQLWRQFVTKKRILPFSEHDAMEFLGTDLHTTADIPQMLVDVRLGFAPDINESLQQVKVLAELQFLSPANPADRKRIKRLLGENLVRADDDEDEIHRGNASIENEQIINGKPFEELMVMPGDWDDIHIEAHRAFTISPAFKRKAKKDRRLIETVKMHIRAHIYNKHMKTMTDKVIEAKVQRTLTNAVGDQLKPAATEPGQGSPGGTAGDPNLRVVQQQGAA